MSNKRGPEDISEGSKASPGQQSEDSSPKRSKLDFLAMIAEMSEKKDGDQKGASAPAPAVESPAKPSEKPHGKPTKSESKTSSADILSPAKKTTPSKSDAPKSSFAAWKLAKGRKNGAKSPSRKEISVGRTQEVSPVRKDLAVASSTTNNSNTPGAASSASKDVSVGSPAKKVPSELTTLVPSAAPVKEAFPDKKLSPAAVVNKGPKMPASLPPKKAMKKEKDHSSKKSAVPKKASVSVKKDKEGLAPKKAVAKKAAAMSGKASATKVSGKVKSKKGDQSNSKASTFPEKIMDLLQAGLAPNAIYWLPEGEAIAVDPDNFKDSTVISKQFRGNKLSSFVRSLNRWGFRRIFYHSLPDKTLAFYHRLFQKQSPDLVKEMKMDGGEKDAALPPGALLASLSPEGFKPPAAAPESKKPQSPAVAAARPAVLPPPRAEPAIKIKSSPVAAAAAAPPLAVAVSQPAPVPPIRESPMNASAAAAAANLAFLERNGVDLSAAEGHHALQQAMVAEQERSDLALQQLQAQQILLQSLAEQQNAAQAEELLMQSMLAEQQRSELAMQQRQAEHALLQQMLAEEQTAALAAALQGGAGGFNADALLRERLFAMQYGNAGPAPAAGGHDILALLQQQLQQHGQVQAQQAQAREPSYMEQLLLLEQQQQQQRQQEAALLARGFRFG